MGIFPNDFSGKTNPNANDKIILADSEDNDNTDYCLLSSLFNAVFFGKTSDDINEGTTNRFYTTSRENELLHNTGNQNIDGDLTITGSFNGDGSGITGITAEVNSSSLNYTLGEDITAGKACSLNTTDGKIYAGGTNFVGILQISKLAGEVGKVNTGYDNNQTGLTPGSYYGYDEVNGDIITGDKFYAISETELDLTQKYKPLQINTQSEYIAGENLEKGNALYIETDGKVYKTDASDITKINFIGFANNIALAGENVSVNTSGVDNNQSGLVLGEDYVLGGGIDDISNATYLDSFYVGGQDTAPYGVVINVDGTKIFICGNGGDSIYEYILSTPYDITTATYNATLYIGGQDTYPSGIFFKDDGLEMYMIGNADNIYRYTLSTAWDITTASYINSFYIGGQDTDPAGIFFKDDGTEVYIGGKTNDNIYRYTLSTAWDITTATYINSFSINGQGLDPSGIYFHKLGKKMYVLSYTNKTIYKYTLSTAWDITTATFLDSFDISGQTTYPYGISFSNDYSYFYTVDAGGDNIYRYSLNVQYPGSIGLTTYGEYIKVGKTTSATDIEIQTNNDGHLTGITSTTATAGGITPPNIEGFITIKVNGVDKKIAYYGV